MITFRGNGAFLEIDLATLVIWIGIVVEAAARTRLEISVRKMPFMKGPAPIRRTWKYLQAGKIILKERVKIFTINYNTKGDHHAGARDFVFWYLPQLQYKNPEIQVVTFTNLTPSPFIRCFLDNDEEVLIDVDSKNKDEINDYLKKILGKSE